jgi:pimeloyl-ACP methyl ester carboxylesterase
MNDGTVVIVPGLAGSNLDVDFVAIGKRHIWLDYAALAGSAVRALELAEDGVSPESPSVVETVEFGPALSSYYQTAYDYFNQYAVTKRAGYDWRLDLARVGSDFADDLRPLLAEGPVYLVCHSMGGLVARRAEMLLRGSADYNNLKRIYLVGTPNYGSWAAVQALAGISYWFRPYIRVMASVAGFWTADLAADFIRRAISHFTSILELMPDPFHGPYVTDPNVLPLYQLDTWSAFNSNLVQNLLDKAKTFRAELSSPPDGNLFATVTGIGFPSIRDVYGIHRLDDPKDYIFADDGDGVVWAPACRIPGVNGATIYSEHTALMTNIKVFDFIRDTMCCGVPADVVLV